MLPIFGLLRLWFVTFADIITLAGFAKNTWINVLRPLQAKKYNCKYKFTHFQHNREQIRFHLISSPHAQVILGQPWLTHHKPHLTWSAGKVVSRSSFCHNTYLQSALPSCRNNPLSSLSSFLAINYLSLWAIPWHHHFHKTASEKYLSSCGDEWKKAINTPLWHFVYLVYQKFHPCAFFPHRLSPAERNEDVGNRELLAVK